MSTARQTGGGSAPNDGGRPSGDEAAEAAAPTVREEGAETALLASQDANAVFDRSVVMTEGELTVLEAELKANSGLRLADAPIAPTFDDLTHTGIGPGRMAPGLSVAAGGHVVDGWPGAAVLHGTYRGASHADLGHPCQDAAGVRVAGDIVLMAVSDGVSAGRESHRVSAAAVERSLDHLAEMVASAPDVASLDMTEWCDLLNSDLQDAVQSIELRTPSDAATVVVAAIDLSGTAAAIARVGDASAWRVSDSGRMIPLLNSSKETADGIVSGSTHALPSSDPQIETSVVDLTSTRALLLCTDGVGDELGSGRSRYALWLSRFLARTIDPLSFSYALGMRSRGASDDRGAAVCWLPATAED